MRELEEAKTQTRMVVVVEWNDVGDEGGLAT